MPFSWTSFKKSLVSLGHLRWRGNPEKTKKPVPYWFHVPLQIIAGGFVAYWLWKPPLPNKAVLVLAGIAALMFLAEMRPIQKAIYVLLVLALVATENRTINSDRAKFERDEACRRQQENQQFQNIGTSITTSVQKLLDHSDLEFAKTMDRSNRILAGVDDSVKTETGGDSYLWYEPTVGAFGENAMEGYKNTVILNAYPRVIGHYSLPVAHVEVFGPDGWIFGGGSSTPYIEYQGFGPNELARSRQGVSIKFAQEKNKKELFHIFINTPNGSYEQQILIEKVGEQWEFAARLFKMGKKKPLRVSASQGFPKDMLRPLAVW